MTAVTLSLAAIRRALAAHRPAVLPADRPHAAVALLLADAAPVPEALFIVRAHHDRDPWSGDIGFPGGRVAAADADPRFTAERETGEELALDLTACERLGRLDDLYGATLPILVSCFVYAIPQRPGLTANREVEATFWIPLDRLLDPKRHRLESFDYRGHPTTQPVADLLGPGAPLLWGITYRLLRNFFAILDLPFGPDPPLAPRPNHARMVGTAGLARTGHEGATMDERRYRRIPFEAEMQMAVGDRNWNCRLLDIALKGALLESAIPLPLPQGTIASLALPLPGSAIVLAFDAELIHREENRLGFKFLHENLETLTHLRTLLELNTGDPEGVRSELLTWLKG